MAIVGRRAGGAAARGPRARGEAVEGPGRGPSDIVTEVGRRAPLSLSQEAVWASARADDPALHASLAVRLRGPLAVPALERALAEVVRRHSALRTRIVEEGGRPVQVVGGGGRVSLAPAALHPRLRPGSDEEGALYARLRATEEARRPFDLHAGPLARAGLHRIGPRDHLLLLTAHRLVCDERSVEILCRELGAFYAGFVAGRSPTLPPPAVGFVDHAARERARLTGGGLDEAVAFWRGHLRGMPPLRLGTQFGEGAAGGRSARHPLTLPAPLVDRLATLAAREGTTPAVVLLAAYRAALARAGGGEDVAVAVPWDGRDGAARAGAIGGFAATLALRTGCGGNPTFRELLAREAATAVAAEAHRGVPFGPAVAEGGGTAVAAGFALRTRAAVPLNLPGLRVSTVEVEVGAATVDLSLDLVPAGGELRGWLEYATARIAAADAVRLADDLRGVLGAMTDDPERRLSSLPAAIGSPATRRPGRGGGLGAVPTRPAASVLLQSGGTGEPVFLVPGGSGGAAALFKAATVMRRADAGRPAYGFLARASEEEAVGWVASLTAAYADEMRERQPRGPYRLVGFCVGGVLAVETARRLLAAGEEVAAPIVIDAWRPGSWLLRNHPRALRPAEERRALAVARAAFGRSDGIPGGGGADVGVVPGEDGAPEDDPLSPRTLRLLRHEPEPYPGRVVLLANGWWADHEASLGWEGLARDGVVVDRLPGDHRTCLVEDVDAAADRLRVRLGAPTGGG